MSNVCVGCGKHDAMPDSMLCPQCAGIPLKLMIDRHNNIIVCNLIHDKISVLEAQKLYVDVLKN